MTKPRTTLENAALIADVLGRAGVIVGGEVRVGPAPDEAGCTA